MSGDRGDTENDRGESRLSATRGVPERRAAPGRALLARISANAHAYVESTGGKPPLRVLSVVLIALLMVTSLAAPIGMAAGAASGPPDGMTGVPADNVGPPDNAQGNGPGAQGGGDLPDAIPTDAAAWSIHASEHAGDLGVEIDAVDDELVLRLSDERNHDGREVAVDRATLVEAVGHEPEAAFGVHESGDEWVSEITYSDGYAVFEVPKFSTNDVTFTSAIEITGTPASDGATFGYEIEDGESVDNFEIALTGADATSAESRALGELDDGDSTTIAVGGTTDTQDGTLTLTGASGPEAGVQQWTEQYDSSTDDVAATEETLIAAAENNIIGYDPETGAEMWVNSDYSNIGVIGASESSGTVGMTDGGSAALFDPESGEIWSWSAPDSAFGITPAADGQTAYIGLEGDTGQTSLAAINGGSVDWEIEQGYKDYARLYDIEPAPDGSVVYAGGSTDVHAHDTEDGSIVRTFDDVDSTSEVAGMALSHDGEELYVVFGSDLYAFDAETTNRLWSMSLSNEAGDLAIDEQDRLFVGLDGDVMVLDAADQTELFRYTEHPDHGVDGVAPLPDGSSIISTTGSNAEEIHAWGGVEPTEDPAVTVDGETVSVSGQLDGEHSEAVTLSPDEHLVDVSTTSGSVDVSIDWTEVTETIDPRVELNGATVAEHSGTLADGETVTIDADESAVAEGPNDVTVAVSESADGPSGQVGIDYSHTASINQSTEYSGETWSERYEVSREWADDRAEAQLEIPFASDRVVSIRDVELQRDGGDWEPVSDEQYSLDGTKLTVALGDVAAGETTAIRANASKVVVDEGAIEVTEPTVAGDTLDSEIEIVETGADGAGVEIDVTGTVEDSYTHYAHEPSWADADPHAVVEASGTQTLVLAEANAGSTTQVRTLPLAPAPETGEVELRIEDADTPRFTLSPGASEGDTVELGWYDTISGERYVLVDADSDLELDGDRASSPVWFTTDDSGTVLIEQRDSDGGEPVVGPATSGGDGPIPPWSLLLIGVAVSVTGLWGVSRRFGGDERGVRGNALVLVGGAAVALVAVELSTAESAIALMVGAVIDSVAGALGSAAASAAGTIVVGLGILVGLWLLDQRTEREVPTWLVVLGGAVTTLWIVETIAPGALTEPLASGLDEVGPLVWLALLGGGGWLGYRYVQARGEPDTEVTLELGGEP